MLKVGITHGDINGISYEIIIKALSDERMCEMCTPVIFGSAKLVGYYKKVLGIDDFPMNQITSPRQAKDGVVNLVNIIDGEVKVEMGKATAEAGKAALQSLDAAIEALKEGSIDVLVTSPINKNTIHSDAFPFTGHTEYLQAKLADMEDEEETDNAEETDESADNGKNSETENTDADKAQTSDKAQSNADKAQRSDTQSATKALMILFNGQLRVALVTNHLPVAEIASHIKKNLVVNKLTGFNSTLIQDFELTRPRIAVLSLNPHCGDDGLIGDEENSERAPAIKEAFAAGIMAFGPFAADGFFGSGRYKNFDGILAMYHDQGLAPFKLLAEENGVNFTACLPFVRTSPAHGTGYDIAGKNEADPSSLRQAIYEATDIYRRRKTYLRAAANPLRKQYVERGADKTIDLSKESDSDL
jgi:4-hydroxythreonine-4-phosphate dehydrogenase